MLAVFMGSTCTLIELLGVGQVFENAFSKPIAFHLRNHLGLSPAISNELVIFRLDNHSVAKVGQQDLPLPRWGRLLRTIAARRPKAVFIDKVFAFPSQEELAQVGTFTAELRASGLQDNLYTAAIASIKPLPGQLLLQHVGKGSANQDLQARKTVKSKNSLLVYGPHAALAGNFSNVGYLGDFASSEIMPNILTSTGGRIPYLGLAHSFATHKSAKGFASDRRKNQLLTQDIVPINFVDWQTLQASHMHSLGELLSEPGESGKLSLIQAGNTVVILSAEYTGGVKLAATPLGSLPHGFGLASVVNSTLTNQWLTQKNDTLLILWASLATLVLIWMGPKRFHRLVLFVPVLVISFGMVRFLFLAELCGWGLPFLASTCTSLILLAGKRRAEHVQKQKLATSLASMVPASYMPILMRNIDAVQTEPCERVVSVMFVDLARFSAYAERKPADLVFKELQKFTSLVRNIVHAHGGMVGKPMGNGMMAFFGHNFMKNQSAQNNHAELCLRAAIQIQEYAAHLCAQATTGSGALLAPRIGISTSDVHIGDVGTKEQFDFNLIGSGVNLAKTLESTCDPFRIQVSANTYDLFPKDKYGSLFAKKLIKSKYSDDWVTVHEHDPFAARSEVVKDALSRFRQTLNLARGELRWTVPDSCKLYVEGELGTGKMHDFSASGFAVELPVYLTTGVIFNGKIRFSGAGDQHVRQLSVDLLDVTGEIRWGRPLGGQFLHGVLLKNMNAEQKRKFLEVLRNHIKNYSSSPKSG